MKDLKDIFGVVVVNVVIIAVIGVVLLIANAAGGSSPARATHTTLCADGWVSHSTGSGTCSWHGGEATP